MPPKSASPTVKPRLNVYTMLLMISLIAIITACVLLWQSLAIYIPEGGSIQDAWTIPPATISIAQEAPAALEIARLA